MSKWSGLTTRSESDGGTHSYIEMVANARRVAVVLQVGGF